MRSGAGNRERENPDQRSKRATNALEALPRRSSVHAPEYKVWQVEGSWADRVVGLDGVRADVIGLAEQLS